VRKLLFTAATIGLAATVFSSPASADPIEYRCYTPHVGPWPTVEVCFWLPELELE
jgi:hypothetical protein